eukprot:CAMPEP_0182443096 /NCGR_PEP_ID=MMETSP1172-20130603/1923_1 /TAXON_ID=708627 /ORGANISM="Timspurckia oligopyrenoides, Strain CCMP3278" /LENGTH=530 /DNA_ID=CAMNT_0024638263 /DNA_START=352 /DNA_END=1944 /DNA_ORIENTATION=+
MEQPDSQKNPVPAAAPSSLPAEFVDVTSINRDPQAVADRRRMLLERLSQIDRERQGLLKDIPSSTHAKPTTSAVPSSSGIAENSAPQKHHPVVTPIDVDSLDTPLSPSQSMKSGADALKKIRSSPRVSRARSPAAIYAALEADTQQRKMAPPGSKTLRYHFCLKLTREFLKNKDAAPFAAPITELWPVDALPGYFEVVKRPMDFRTVRENLENGVYVTDLPPKGKKEPPEKVFDYRRYAEDMRMVLRNSMLYNRPGEVYYERAKELLAVFEARFAEFPLIDGPIDDKKRTHERRSDGRKKSKRSKVVRTSSNGNGPGSPRSPGAGGAPRQRKKRKEDDMTTEQIEELVAHLRSQKMALELASSSPAGSPRWSPLPALNNVPMTYEEKARLGDNINRLPPEKLGKLIQIATHRAGQAEVNQNQEIELDIESLDIQTLREMEAYVNDSLARHKGGLKKKTLAGVSEQLRHYENVLQRRRTLQLGDQPPPVRSVNVQDSSQQDPFEEYSSYSSGSGSGSGSGDSGSSSDSSRE